MLDYDYLDINRYKPIPFKLLKGQEDNNMLCKFVVFDDSRPKSKNDRYYPFWSEPNEWLMERISRQENQGKVKYEFE